MERLQQQNWCSPLCLQSLCLPRLWSMERVHLASRSIAWIPSITTQDSDLNNWAAFFFYSHRHTSYLKQRQYKQQGLLQSVLARGNNLRLWQLFSQLGFNTRKTLALTTPTPPPNSFYSYMQRVTNCSQPHCLEGEAWPVNWMICRYRQRFLNYYFFGVR